MTYPRQYERPIMTDSLAAVAISSGGTVQGRIVACDLNGRVTLKTSSGWITGRPVAAELRPVKNWLGGLFSRK